MNRIAANEEDEPKRAGIKPAPTQQTGVTGMDKAPTVVKCRGGVYPRPYRSVFQKALKLKGETHDGYGNQSIIDQHLRTLSIDAVEKVKSGHPGTPMALAPLVYTIWNRLMNFDPQDPIWPNRDRFGLSNGHASMLLWSILHLTGVKAVNADYERLGQPSVTLDDIKRFRQIDSKAPGHPEYHWVSGVETTTGPLGQGVATSVGMAIAEKWVASRYNKPGFQVFDYKIYAVCGDGCMMEGVASEAASLAGHLGLDNLCWVWDNNRITIEGNTSITFTEDVAARFLAYGWNVLRVGDANDIDRIERALGVFRKTKGRPTFIVLDSHIGYGSPHKQDTPEAHGEALGDEEVRLTKRDYGWPEDAQFLVPDGVYDHFAAGIGQRGATARQDWTKLITAYGAEYPDLAKEIDQMQRRELPAAWDQNLPSFPADPKGIAGCEASGNVLNVLAQNIPWLLGGSADLAPSNKTALTYKGAGSQRACRCARRESGSDPHRLRQRSQPGLPGSRDAGRRRHPVPRGVDAVVGHLRPSAEGIPGKRVATRREGAHRHRAGLDAWLGAVHWRRGSRHRHEYIRGVGPPEGVAEALRFRARPGRGLCERAARQKIRRDWHREEACGGRLGGTFLNEEGRRFMAMNRVVALFDVDNILPDEVRAGQRARNHTQS